jgi:hypothetical protein
MEVFFDPCRARHVLVRQTGIDETRYWSIHEFGVYTTLRCQASGLESLHRLKALNKLSEFRGPPLSETGPG